jgi:hypothetical protein
MKLPAIILVIIALGLGFAAGSFFNPVASHLALLTKPADSESRSTSGSGAPFSASGQGGSRQTAAKAPDLATLMKDPNPEAFSYRHIKDVMAYADTLSPDEIPGIMRQLEAMPDARKKMMILSILTMRWADADPQGALAWSQKKGGGQFEYFMRREAAQLAYGAMAERDPTNALSQAQQLPAGPKRDQAVLAVANQMAETDPVQALKLTQNMPNGGGTNEIFSRWADKDPAQATQALLQLPSQERRLEAVNGMASTMVGKDPQAAVAWLDQLPAGKVRDTAQERVASAWAESDPQAALA